jgi:aldehyde dehydrogenase (NAD+)
MTAAPQSLGLSNATIDAIPALVESLRATFQSGRTRPLEWRRQQLERLKSLLADNADRLTAALREDLGKPDIEAWATDISIVIGECKLALSSLGRWTQPESVSVPLNQKPGAARIVREPLGVVLIIAPWNYPVQLLLSPLVGAIAAGNCAVLKPSEVTPHVSALLAELAGKYLDRDAIALVEGGVDETTALLEQRFDHIFYTGNGAVGRIVLQAAVKHLTPVTLELGGKSPCIVAADANLDVAARRIAWGKWLNAGQTCIAPDYVLVDAAVEPQLIDRLVSTVHEFYGDDPRQTADYGRIVSQRHLRRLVSLIEGCEVVTGGQSDEAERYLAPTILRNVQPDAKIMTEEIFGPILPIVAVPDVEAAIRFVNEREKPLALYVFTGNDATAERVLGETSSGGACVNATIWHVANPHLPFGGVGPSGMGSYHGRGSFETFSHRRAVVSKTTRIDPKLVYPPYSKLKKALVKRFA